MTLDEFITKYTGQSNVGDTPENIGQCVGLIEVYTDMLGLPHTWGNAKDLFTTADPSSFDIIQNTPTNFPLAGDILVFGTTYGNGSGHTGIVVTADANTVTLFEQNDPVGSTPHETRYNYPDCLGWLHPKVSTLPTNYNIIIQKATQWDETCQALDLGDPNTTLYDTLSRVIAGYKSRETDWTNKLNQSQKDLAVANQTIVNDTTNLANEKDQCEQNTNLLLAQITKLKKNVSDEQNLMGQYVGTITTLQGNIGELNNQINTLKQELAGLNAPIVNNNSLWKKILLFLNKYFQ